MITILFVALFGMVGVLLRFAVNALLPSAPTGFPWATFVVNLCGAFLVGMTYVAGFERELLSPDLRKALLVGFLGGLTTFSAYSLDSVLLAAQSRYALAAAYAGLTPLLGLPLTWVGVQFARRVL